MDRRAGSHADHRAPGSGRHHRQGIRGKSLFSIVVSATNAPSTYGATGFPSANHFPNDRQHHGNSCFSGKLYSHCDGNEHVRHGDWNADLLVQPLSEGIAVAVEATGRTFTSSGNATWIPQTLYAHDGVDAARSGTIGNLSQSVVTLPVTGPATGSFYWGVSSEDTFDFLHFSVDGVDQGAISGEVGWTLKNFTLTPGPHILAWSYIKDDYVKSGLDSGFFDQLHIIQDLDGDGFMAEMELYFGTSDTDAGQVPVPSMTTAIDGVTIHFPAVPGNGYLLESSTDMSIWTPVTITADGPTVNFLDPETSGGMRKFYRVTVP